MIKIKSYIHLSLPIFFAVLLIFPTCQPKSDVCENAKELVQEIKSKINEIPIDQYISDYQSGAKDYLLIDVRQEKEFDNGNIEGAVCIPRGILEFKINDATFWEEQMMYAPEDTTNIIIYCKKGSRGALATAALQELGYKNVNNLSGGYLAYQQKQQREDE